ncbi:MAG TPA: DUF6702 family protein [Chitinophagaceae bacterium]|nr:DUF6702 family protein [Chitinophagaceae bacterium]
MVTSVNKWLPVSAFIILIGFIKNPMQITRLHPFHVSTTEINHNASDKTLEISCKVFIDDFESALAKQYHTKADLSAVNMKTAMDTLVKKYIKNHLLLNADGKTLVMKYLGFEKENEAIYAYLEVDNISAVKKIEVTDTILYDLYDDEISIVHVIVGGNRKSTKLDYPATRASIEF